MHKLASKTMIEILPDRLIKFIESKLGSIESTPDFFDVIGQVINNYHTRRNKSMGITELGVYSDVETSWVYIINIVMDNSQVSWFDDGTTPPEPPAPAAPPAEEAPVEVEAAEG